MNASTQLGQLIIDELVRHGVHDIVVCPGSRSAPLAFAAVNAHDAGNLRMHVRIDERSAAFLALGMAIATARPVAIVVTSGTAVANLHPAIVEAHHAHLPIVVLSANRPVEMQGTGASQTIEQTGLFGPHTRSVVQLQSLPQHQPKHHRSAISRALLRATFPADPGPVQIDVGFSEPLVPPLGLLVHEQGREQLQPWISRPRMDTHDDVALTQTRIDLSIPTIVIAGMGAWLVPDLLDVPTVAEPVAPAPRVPVHPLALPHLNPQQIVVVGRPTLHRDVMSLIADPSKTVYALSRYGDFFDVGGNVSHVAGNLTATGQQQQQWIAQCQQLTHLVNTCVEEDIFSSTHCHGMDVAAVVADSLQEDDHLIVGASNPIRDISLVGLPTPGITISSNRGAAGIDGTISTAVGIALSTRSNVTALMGDITFLHDIGGLLIGPTEPVPRNLTIVVANDNGGAIFTLLEQGDAAYSHHYERLFATPHNTQISALCEGYSISHQHVNLAHLRTALAQRDQGIRVLEVVTTREGLRQRHRNLRATIAAASREH